MKPKIPTAPRHLNKESRQLWRQILTQWTIEDSASLAVLRVGLEAYDRAQRCRQQIDAEGETVKDRFDQVKPHPLLSAERDARSAFLAGIKALRLDIEALMDNSPTR